MPTLRLQGLLFRGLTGPRIVVAALIATLAALAMATTVVYHGLVLWPARPR